MLPDVTLVIPQRNFGLLTRNCIEALREQETISWPVIVVDDGSEDASAVAIRAADFAACIVIEQPQRGVTAAWNAGLRQVATPFAVLLNNDVVISGPFVERLIAPLRNRQALIAGVEWRIEPVISRRVLAGWCFGFAHDLWRELGGFDESLRWYFSDTDFQCRAATNPAVMTVVPGLPLRHLGHQTTQHDPRRRAMWQSDRARFLAKHPEAAGSHPRGSA